MDLSRYVVDSVVLEGRSQRSVAGAVGRSVGWVNKQAQLYREGGYEALAPKRRGAHSFPNQTSAEIEDEIITIRKYLDESGFDAGARTIRYHLHQRHGWTPSISTIHAVLKRRGFVVPQPQKRPRNSWEFFESDLANETWQSDITEWALADDTPVEIVNFEDDYSRLITGSTVFLKGVKSTDIVKVFHKCAQLWGFPSSLLTDNGATYTASYRNGVAALETEMYGLGILVKHGRPYHPQTQGKIERFHQTLKRWLKKQRRAKTVTELQAQVDYFIRYYNEERPHSAKGGIPPLKAWRSSDKATPKLNPLELTPKTRVRHDKIDTAGRFSLRHNGKMHHIGVGRTHKGKRVIVLVADLDIRVLNTDGELLRHLTLDPTRDYQPLTS